MVAAAERQVAIRDMTKPPPKGFAEVVIGDSIDGTVQKRLRLPFDETTGLLTYEGKQYHKEQLYSLVGSELTDVRGRQLRVERAREVASNVGSTFKSMTASGVNSAQTWLKTKDLDPMKVFADFFSSDRVAQAHQEALEESKIGSRMPQQGATPLNNPQSSNSGAGKAPMQSIVSRPNMSEVNPHVNSFPAGLA